MTALYIDADACPVKEEAERVATRHRVRMFVVSNGGLRPSRNPLVETVIVPDGPDVADMWIADRAGTGDGWAAARRTCCWTPSPAGTPPPAAARSS